MAEPRLDVDRILEIAAQEFAQHGFERMSMRTLAEKCSATAAALYYHFSSKEALYDEVCNRIFDAIADRIGRELKSARNAEERLERIISVLFDAWNDSTLLLLTQRDAINVRVSPGKSFSPPLYRQLFGLSQTLQAQYFGDEIDDALSFAFCSMVFGYCSHLVYSQRESGESWEAHCQRRKGDLLAVCRTLLHNHDRR